MIFRIPRYLMFLDMAAVVCKRSTCYRGNVGAILTYKDNPVSIGYNGPAPGEPHCEGNSCKRTTDGKCIRAIHAEVNVINRMPKELRGKSCKLYSTTCPCVSCAMFIVGSGIRLEAFFFQGIYSSRTGIDYLIKSMTDTQFFRVTPAGYCIDQRTGELVDEA